MKLKKHRIIVEMQNGYVLCKLQSYSFPDSYFLYNKKMEQAYHELDMRCIPTIIKMCEVNSEGDYALKSNI